MSRHHETQEPWNWRSDSVGIDQLARLGYCPTFQDPRNQNVDMTEGEARAWYADVGRQLQANAAFDKAIETPNDPAMAVTNQTLRSTQAALEALASGRGWSLQ